MVDRLRALAAAPGDARSRLLAIVGLFAERALAPARTSWALRVLGRELVAPFLLLLLGDRTMLGQIFPPLRAPVAEPALLVRRFQAMAIGALDAAERNMPPGSRAASHADQMAR